MAAYSKADLLQDGTIRPGASPVVFKVRWYQIPKSFPPMPWPHYFVSRTWEKEAERYDAIIGEVWGFTPLDHTPRPPTATAQRYCGSAANWLAGVGFDPALPNVPRDAWKLPTCCGGQVIADGELGLAGQCPGPDTLTLRSVPISKGALAFADVQFHAKQSLALTAPAVARGGLAMADPLRVSERLGLAAGAVQGDNLALADVPVSRGGLALEAVHISRGGLALEAVHISRGGLALKDTVHGDGAIALADVPISNASLGLSGSYATFDNVDCTDIPLAQGETTLADVPVSRGGLGMIDVPISIGQFGLTDGGKFGDGLAISDGGSFGDGLALGEVAQTSGATVLASVPLPRGNLADADPDIAAGAVAFSDLFRRSEQLGLASPAVSVGGLGLSDVPLPDGAIELADGLRFGDGLALTTGIGLDGSLGLSSPPVPGGDLMIADVPVSEGSIALTQYSVTPGGTCPTANVLSSGVGFSGSIDPGQVIWFVLPGLVVQWINYTVTEDDGSDLRSDYGVTPSCDSPPASSNIGPWSTTIANVTGNAYLKLTNTGTGTINYTATLTIVG